MKGKKLIILTIVVLLIGGFLFIDFNNSNTTKTLAVTAKKKGAPANQYFVDTDFYMLVISAYNKEYGTSYTSSYVLTDEQLASIHEVYQYLNTNYNIEDTTGLEKLTGLKKLNLNNNEYLKTIDVSHNTDLEVLSLNTCKISSIDVSNNTKLTSLTIYGTNISEIDVSNNTSLTNLNLGNNNISAIDVSDLTLLTDLSVSRNNLQTIDVSNNVLLEELSVFENHLTSLDVTHNTALERLDAFTNSISSINLSNNTALKYLSVSSNNLTSINLANNSNLTYVGLSGNKLSSVDLSNNLLVSEVTLQNNELTTVTFGNNDKITTLDLSYNKFAGFDLTGLSSLKTLNVASNLLTDLDDVNELTALKTLTISSNNIKNLDLSDISGLTTLTADNIEFESIDLSGNGALTSLSLEKCQLTDLDLSNNTNLTKLFLTNNLFEDIDVSNNVNLKTLWISNNKLQSIDLSNNSLLTSISLAGNSNLNYFKIEKGKSIENPIKLADNYTVDITINDETIAQYDSTTNKYNALKKGKVAYQLKAYDTTPNNTALSISNYIEVFVPATGVTLDKSTADVYVNGLVSLHATVAPEDVSNKEVTWESSDPSVATVSNGVVKGISDGVATITVTTTDGGFTASCEVTVTTEKVNVNYYANDGSNNVITREVVKNSDVTLESNSFTRTGYAFSRWNTKADGSGRDYYPRNIIKPTADVDLYAIYTRVIDSTFTVTGIVNKTYTGKNLTQKFAVYDGATIVRYKTDFVISYSNNKNIGIASVKISGIGNYSSSITKEFKILPKTPTLKKVTSPKKGYAQMVYTSVAGGVYYQFAYKQKGASKWTQKNTKLTTKTMKGFKSGKYYYFTVRAYKTVGGKVFYSPWSNKIKIKIK